MKKLFLFTCTCWLMLCLADAQDRSWKKLSQIHLPAIDMVSSDRMGNIFVTNRDGEVRQFGITGDSINIYSPAIRARWSTLEAGWTTNIFLFSADLQHFELLDRFLRPISTGHIRDTDLGIINHATLGNNNVIWMVDETRLSLVRWDYRRNVLLQEQQLGLVLDVESPTVLAIAERKNKLILHLKDYGLYILDNQGNPIKRLQNVPNQTLEIGDDHYYYLSGINLVRVNYLTEEEYEFTLPKSVYQKVALTPKSILLTIPQGIEIFARPEDL